MTSTPTYTNAPDLSTDAYVVIGLATCYLKEDGEIEEVAVVEPIPSAALEALDKGIPTSYQKICATTLGAVLGDGMVIVPEGFPADVQLCSEFAERAIAAARTYKARPIAQNIVPAGTTRDDLNYSTERKRVLNAKNVVSTEDNVKQHEYTHKVL